jgi:small redox-active disulfide protein 2
MLEIKVLGTGCPNCKKLAKNAEAAAQRFGAEFNFEYVNDMGRILMFGVLAMPGLVVNDEVVTNGQILTEDEIYNILKKI